MRPVGSGGYLWVLKIVVYGFKIIGLAPFTLEIDARKMFKYSRSRTSKAVECSFSSMGAFYNLLLTTINIAVSAVAIPRYFAMYYTNKSVITEVVDMMYTPLCVSVACIILTFWAFRQGNAASIMNRLVKIDYLLSGLNIKPPSRKMMVLCFMVHVVVSVSIWIAFFTSGVMMYRDNPWLCVCYATSNFIIYCFMTQYFVIVGLVSTDIETINKTLSTLNDFTEHSYYCNTTVINVSTYSQLATVRLLKTIRTRVSEASRDIAEFYSSPMLGCIVYSFVTLVYNIYYLITPFLVPDDDLSISIITFTIMCILVGFYPLILLSFKITKLENEAKLTGWVIQKLLATVLRQDIKAELEQFSHQLLHENISFKSCGFFSLDCTLLHSMLAAAATYLVILLQFLQSTHT